MRFECQSCLNVFDGQTPTFAGPCPRCGSTYSIIAPTGTAASDGTAQPGTGAAGYSAANQPPAAAGTPQTPPTNANPAASALGVAPTMAQPAFGPGAPAPPAPPGIAPNAAMYPPPAAPTPYPLPQNVGAPAAFGSQPYPLPYAPMPGPAPAPQYFGQNPFTQAQNGLAVMPPQVGPDGVPLSAEQINTTTPMILGVVSLLCGCMPLGIASIVLSQQANEALRIGDLIRAKDRVRTATLLSVANLVLMGIGIAIYVLALILSGPGGI